MATHQFDIKKTLNAPTSKVWQALTDINQLKKWLPFFPDFKPEIGFRTEFNLGPDKDHQYNHKVKVLEVIPQKKLVYSWDYGGISPDSYVAFNLSPNGNQTDLTLTVVIDPLPTDQPDFISNASAGWNHTAESLSNYLEK